jgi:hypothetical protein
MRLTYTGVSNHTSMGCYFHKYGMLSLLLQVCFYALRRCTVMLHSRLGICTSTSSAHGRYVSGLWQCCYAGSVQCHHRTAPGVQVASGMRQLAALPQNPYYNAGIYGPACSLEHRAVTAASSCMCFFLSTLLWTFLCSLGDHHCARLQHA